MARLPAAWKRRSCRSAEDFITPMAAVAGSVADEMMAAMLAGRKLDKAYVNNGGDIALHLGSGQSMTPRHRRHRPWLWPTASPSAPTIRFAASPPAAGAAAAFRWALPMPSPCWRGRRRGRCGGDDHRQRRRPARPSGHQARAGARPCARQRSRRPAGDDGGRPAFTRLRSPTALDSGLAVAEEFRRSGLIAARRCFLAGRGPQSVGSIGASPRPTKDPREGSCPCLSFRSARSRC